MEISVTLDLMYKMDSKIVIFEGNQKDGIFSRSKRFYKEGLTEEEIEEEIKKARIRLGEKYHFPGLKMFQVRQKMEDSDIYPDNKAVLLDERYMQKEDYFQEKIEADILIIEERFKNIAVAHRMADCPVLIAEDRLLGITAIAHCGIYHINRELPKELIKTLIREFHSNPENIYLYIGSHIKKENYYYDTYPNQATNKEVWKEAILEMAGKYQINLEKAIRNQLREFSLGEIKASEIDTATHPDYASHRKEKEGNPSKKGQNIVGFYYK